MKQILLKCSRKWFWELKIWIPRNKSIFCSALFTFLALHSKISHSSDFHSARTDGLGGAGHASPLLGDSVYLNPSSAPYIFTHSLAVNYLVYGQGTTQSPSGPAPYYGHNINASVTDGTPEALFQAGVGYTAREDSSLIHIIAAKEIIQKLSIGIGGKFIFPTNSPSEHPFEATLSATGLLNSWLQVSLIGDNLLESAKNFGFYRELILGTKFNAMGIVFVYLDPHIFGSLASPQLFGYEAGAEFPFFSDLFLRIGTFKNSTVPYQAQLGDGYGAGVGWIAPKLSLEYAVSRALSPIAAISHNFGVSIYF